MFGEELVPKEWPHKQPLRVDVRRNPKKIWNKQLQKHDAKQKKDKLVNEDVFEKSAVKDRISRGFAHLHQRTSGIEHNV